MGCAAGKPDVIGDNQPGKEFEKPPQKPVRTAETVLAPPIVIDDSITISARTSQGLAFEVPLEESETNVIKKDPPKRFQRLEDQQMSLTHRLLDEKQAEADQRRQQILSQRVQSAKVRQRMKRPIGANGDSNGFLIESMHQEPTTVAL